jgi:RNA polymerase sigma-70 factor (ECF subfamily)
VEENASLDLRQKQVRAALRTLTNDQQQVIMLKFIEGWDNSEIACMVGKPISAVKALQHRALERLKKLLLAEA